MDLAAQFGHTGVVESRQSGIGRSIGAGSLADPLVARGLGNPPESNTRTSVVTLLLEDGPISASEIGARLGLSAAGVRRHIDALIDQGEAAVASPSSWRQRGPGRPAKLFQLSPAGRAQLTHAYDDLAGAAMRQLRDIGGDEAVAELARRRIADIVDMAGEVPGDLSEDERLESIAQNIADALTGAGYAASTRKVGSGVQICQHHCPVSHVAAEFPELCEAEREAFQRLLGTHIQQLATIANGDSVCTTHVPLGMPS
ncbi:helix-turn-helix transcriptional regulator [Tomitella biformata]|uniref:helix-turn-helix transcriptional regulator n=1 Tax=Tomitella biformata TaxID=630403 RepID=UPI00057179F8